MMLLIKKCQVKSELSSVTKFRLKRLLLGQHPLGGSWAPGALINAPLNVQGHLQVDIN